ncbi:hypothetical protein D3C85_1272320 [compost metagenome]
MADQLGHEHPANRRTHAAETEHRTHHVLGRVVHHQAPDVRGPGLVRADGQGDGGHRDPQVAGTGRHDHADDAAGEQEHGHQSRLDRVDAATDQERGEDAAANATEVGSEVDDDQRDTHLGDVDAQVVLLVEERRQPVQVEPEHRCGDRVGEGEGPGAAHAQDFRERHAGLFRLDFFLDVVQLRLFHARVVFRVEVLQTPEQQPDPAQ